MKLEATITNNDGITGARAAVSASNIIGLQFSDSNPGLGLAIPDQHFKLDALEGTWNVIEATKQGNGGFDLNFADNSKRRVFLFQPIGKTGLTVVTGKNPNLFGISIDNANTTITLTIVAPVP